jgi:hypothetical protein
MEARLMGTHAALRALEEDKALRRKIIARILEQHNFVVKSEDLDEWLDIIEEFNEAYEKGE